MVDFLKQDVFGKNLAEGDVVETGGKHYFIDQDPYYDIDNHKWVCWIQELTSEQLIKYFSELGFIPALDIKEWDIGNGNNIFTIIDSMEKEVLQVS
jgi:hypothetical protein